MRDFTIVAYDGNGYVYECVTAASVEDAVNKALDETNLNLEERGTLTLADFDVIAIFEGKHKPINGQGAF